MPFGETVHAALAEGDLDGANAFSPVPLPATFDVVGWRGVWAIRRDQVRRHPAAADWVTGAIWDVEGRRVVGRAGFHGPPDETGMVEVGYAVLPEVRRRGYGRAALAALLERAAAEPAVRVVRASVAPDNVASLALVAGFGFVPVGEQWDEEDGLEIVHEVPAGSRSRD